MKVFIESFGTDFDVVFNEHMKVNVKGSAEVKIGKYTTAKISLIDNGGYCWMYLDVKEEDGKEIVVINDLEEGELEIDMEGKEELTVRKLDFEIKFKIDKVSKEYFEILRKNKEVLV